MEAFSQRRALDQMSRVVRIVGVVDAETRDLTAEDVRDQVQVELASHHRGGQERHVDLPPLDVPVLG
jgi:hypothetical protein